MVSVVWTLESGFTPCITRDTLPPSDKHSSLPLVRNLPYPHTRITTIRQVCADLGVGFDDETFVSTRRIQLRCDITHVIDPAERLQLVQGVLIGERDL